MAGKVVVSPTLTDPEWRNTEVMASDVVDRVSDLKNEDDGYIVHHTMPPRRGEEMTVIRNPG